MAEEREPDFSNYRYLLWEQGNPVFLSAYWIKQPLRGDSPNAYRLSGTLSQSEIDELSGQLELVENPKSIGLEFESRYSHAIYRISKDRPHAD